MNTAKRIATEKLGIRVKKTLRKHKYIYIMLIPVFLYYIIFHYIPMYGIVISFQDFSIGKGILGSEWVGLKHIKNFFSSYYSWRLIRNTLMINFASLLLWPAPIILALMLNELRSNTYKRSVQTITYLPHFISQVVIVGILLDFVSTDGLFNQLIMRMGGKPIPFMMMPKWFIPLYVGSGVWQGIGWGSIVYLSALTAIDPNLYEASTIDGAGRWRKMLHITLPGIAPTIIILLILRIGSLMTVGWQKIILMYNPTIYETADVIATFVYRRGLLAFNYSFGTAVGFFQSVLNFLLLIMANRLSKAVSGTSLW
jgi:putative aldouronate transport system permease protein